MMSLAKMLVSSLMRVVLTETCSALETNDQLRTILNRAVKTYEDIHQNTNNIFLTHKQLSEKANQLHKQPNLLQLECLNRAKKVSRLNSVLALHQRFMVLISQNNVLRIKELVSVALKHRRSINYIVEKVLDAIDGVYRTRPSKEDKDLAFLVLKLGGPYWTFYAKLISYQVVPLHTI